MPKKQFDVLGLMSGTSLDGLDIAWCQLEEKQKKWTYKIMRANTLAYSAEWKKKLSGAHELKSANLLALHAAYGHWLGRVCQQFIQKNRIKKLDVIASHGHTVFHQPHNTFTFQLGDGNAIYAQTGIPVVCDFRSLDVQLGGQGAPLVPLGDKLLFTDFDVCLNIGGIANLSLEKNKKRVAFDICFANMGINFLTEKLGLPFDNNGSIASSGNIDTPLHQNLLKFYQPFKATRPSLAREHFENGLSKIINTSSASINDCIRTFTESVAQQIALAIPSKRGQRVLITGGGAHNRFLVSRIAHHLQKKAVIEIPPKQIIDFKEALVFGLLGLLRTQNKINVLKSVTGASRDSSSGAIIGI